MLSVLLGGTVAVLSPTSAEANRSSGPATTTTTAPTPGYVPPPVHGQNPLPGAAPGELPSGPDALPSGPDERPSDLPSPAPRVVPVDLPVLPRPEPDLGTDGDRDRPADTPINSRHEDSIPTNPAIFDRILSRTGAETMPLARAGLAALALGAGLVILARRRPTDVATAPIRPL
jgi:hypothetical protein